MHKVILSVSCRGWAFERIAEQITRYLSGDHHFETSTLSEIPDGERPSCDLLVAYWWQEVLRLRAKVRARKVVACVYDFCSWVDHPSWQASLAQVDALIVGNEELRDLMAKQTKVPIFICRDGVDVDLFPRLPHDPIHLVAGWTGSTQSEVGSGRDGDYKGLSVIAEGCKRAGVPLRTQDARTSAMPHAMMSAHFYSQIGVYICMSRAEGTPNPALEALASGRPVISTPVGLMKELIVQGVTGLLVERHPQALCEALWEVQTWDRERVAMFCRAQAEKQSWERQIAAWQVAIEALLPPVHQPEAHTRQDLRDQVTVFVTTIGDEPNFSECMARLKNQTVDCTIDVIDHVAPMDRAFQAMIDRCKTPFYVQVDEDMLLYPDAIRTLFVEMIDQPETTCMMMGPLWDCDTERPIYGVKMFRHRIMRRFPFADSLSCEMEQSARWKAKGYTHAELPLAGRQSCLGEHGKHYHPETIFKRWKRVGQKQRSRGWMKWIEPFYGRHLDRYLRTKDPIHLAAVLGQVAGLVGPLPPEREMDFRDKDEDWERVQKMYFPEE